MADSRNLFVDTFPYCQFNCVILSCHLPPSRREPRQPDIKLSRMAWLAPLLSEALLPYKATTHIDAGICPSSTPIPLCYGSKDPTISLSDEPLQCCKSVLIHPHPQGSSGMRLFKIIDLPEVTCPHQWEMRLNLASFWECSAQGLVSSYLPTRHKELESLNQGLPQLHIVL